MKRTLIALLLSLAFTAMTCGVACSGESEWPGIDEAVVKKFAEQAGRPAREPYINIAQGDIQLFAFLMAGSLGGFVAGYYWRALFPPRVAQRQN